MAARQIPVALGAGLTGAAAYSTLAGQTVRDTAGGLGKMLIAYSGDSPHANSQGADLASRLSELSNEIRAGGGRRDGQLVTVVRTGQESNWLYIPLALTAGSLIYLQARGLKISDLFFVSRALYKKGLEALSVNVGKGLENLSERVNAFRRGLAERMESLQDRQEQAEVKIDAVSDDIKNINQSVIRVEEKVDVSNRGIHLLCSVVSQTLTANGVHSARAQELIDFLSRLPPLRYESREGGDTLNQGGEQTFDERQRGSSSPRISHSSSPRVSNPGPHESKRSFAEKSYCSIGHAGGGDSQLQGQECNSPYTEREQSERERYTSSPRQPSLW